MTSSRKKKIKSSRHRTMNRRRWSGSQSGTTMTTMSSTPSLAQTVSAIVAAFFKPQKKG